MIGATSPDTSLYPDYDLDDLLVESMLDETQLFFAELVKRNLGVANLVESDFSMLNERLAAHYGIEGVEGVSYRPVTLPANSVRGGLLTQGSVLKITANGTTTSPVVRGAWVMDRLLGKPPSPPPAAVPAVDPDVRGATTIRAQLEKHRQSESCNACHQHIDPAGLALENFDVMGAWRDELPVARRRRCCQRSRAQWAAIRFPVGASRGCQRHVGRRPRLPECSRSKALPAAGSAPTSAEPGTTACSVRHGCADRILRSSSGPADPGTQRT